MVLADRLKEALRDAGESQSGLARKTGISQAAIQKITSGNSKGSTKIVEIAEALGVSPVWLSTGVGPKHGGGSAPPDKRNADEISEPQRADLYDSNDAILKNEVEISITEGVEFIDVDGNFSQSGKIVNKMRIKKDTLREYGATDFNSVVGAIVTGESMSPRLSAGSTVLIDCSDKRIIDGKVYAIDQDGWRRIKCLYRTGPHELTLKSYNAETFPDEVVAITDVEIIGRLFMTVGPI